MHIPFFNWMQRYNIFFELANLSPKKAHSELLKCTLLSIPLYLNILSEVEVR